MTSEPSIFAAQLLEFISFQAEEPTFGLSPDDSLAIHTDAEFNGYALVLFALQFKANARYRKFCEARGVTPDTVTHWTQIPAMPTSAFKELELTSLPPDQRSTVFHSSGTTEQKPGRHFHNAESLALYEASLWPWFARHITVDLESEISNFKLVILTPPPTTAPHSSLVHMFETVRRKLSAPESAYVSLSGNDGAWTLDVEATKKSLHCTCRDKKPLILLGTAFSLVHLLDALEQIKLRIQLPPGSRVMETGGYKGRSRNLLKAELHAMITQRLGVPASHIVSEYGMSELSSQAYDHVVGEEPTPPPSAELRRTGAPSQEGKCVQPRASMLPSSGGGGGGFPLDATRDARYAPRTFRFPPWARTQIISPETGREVANGEAGLIRVVDLANAFSVMSVQTEDLAVRRGDGFELIGRAPLAEPRGCSLMVA